MHPITALIIIAILIPIKPRLLQLIPIVVHLTRSGWIEMAVAAVGSLAVLQTGLIKCVHVVLIVICVLLIWLSAVIHLLVIKNNAYHQHKKLKGIHVNHFIRFEYLCFLPFC